MLVIMKLGWEETPKTSTIIIEGKEENKENKKYLFSIHSIRFCKQCYDMHIIITLC